MTKYNCEEHNYHTSNRHAWAGHQGRYDHQRGKGEKSTRTPLAEYERGPRGFQRLVRKLLRQKAVVIRENTRLKKQLYEANEAYKMMIEAVNSK